MILCVGCATRPKWVLNHPVESDLLGEGEVTLFYGMGAAQTPGEAEEEARESLRYQMKTIVDAMRFDYRIAVRTAGGANYSENFFVSLSRQLAGEIQPNARIVDTGTGPKNICYALAVYRKSEIQRIITDMAAAEAARNADFQIKVVRKSIEMELNKSSTKEWQKKNKPEKVDINQKSSTKNLSWGIGASLGTTFAAPGFIAGIHGSMSPVPYVSLEGGCDFGFGLIGYDSADYYSLYPYIHVNLVKSITPRLAFYGGAGGGLMIANYEFSAPFEDEQWNIPAMDFVIGFELRGFNLSLTWRTNFEENNFRTALGYTYRFH